MNRLKKYRLSFACISAVALAAAPWLLADEPREQSAKSPACCAAKATEPTTTPTDADNSGGLSVQYVAMAHNQPASSRRQRARAMPNYKVTPVDKGGAIEGVIRFEGDRPEDRKLQIVKDHETCEKGPSTRARIRTDDKQNVADAVVYLFDIREGRDFAKREKPPQIDQRNCNFEPHVMAVKAGEDVEILNSDPVAHNINASQRIYTLFNILQPQKDMKATQKFDRPGLVSIRCNVHDWMEAWVWVFRHPYHQVTGDDGAFKLTDIPPGTYQLAVWQETLGETFHDVEVKAGETTKLDIILKSEK